MSTEIYIRTTDIGITLDSASHLGIWILSNGNTARIDGLNAAAFISRYSTDINGNPTNVFDQATINDLGQAYVGAQIELQSGPPTTDQINRYNLNKLDLTDLQAEQAANKILEAFDKFLKTLF